MHIPVPFEAKMRTKFKVHRPRRTKFKIAKFFILNVTVLALSFIGYLLFTVQCYAEENTTITSHYLEYNGETSTYTARGEVNIQKGLVTIEADEVRYNDKTSETAAEGNVIYGDQRVRIKAKRANLNLDLKTGTLYDSEFFSMKDNYHIEGLEIEKIGENEYTFKEASFTTCDAPIPAWCFKGSDVDATLGDKLRAKNATFVIEGLPVFYTPYIVTPFDTERKTGLLRPILGYISSLGFHYEQPFFWAISDNRDVTFQIDAYSKTGIGEGMEYRFLEPDGSKGDLWLYHVRDSEFNEDLFYTRGLYDTDRESRVTAYLSLNYANSVNLYNEYNPYIFTKQLAFLDPSSYLTETTGRYLDSTGELSLKFSSSRLYLTPEYLVDLQAGVDSSTVAQKLPEVGYFMNPQRIGPVVFSLASSAAEFWRETGASGQRLDIYPRFAYSFGGDVVITQALGLRETAYSLSGSDEFGSSPHRESLDYTIIANTSLIKKYSSFTHIIEPSLGYTYIPPSESNLPIFDSTELYTKTSTAELSILNRFINSKGEFLTVRITQPYSTLNGDDHFLPLKFEAAIQRPINLRVETSYNVNTGGIEDLKSDVRIQLPGKSSFSIGESYNKTEDILFFTWGMNYKFSKTISAEGSFWYDEKIGTLSNIAAKLKYQKQCWGVSVLATKSQLNGTNNFSISVLFDLLGLGTIQL